jgi:hypothetical protein
MTARFLLIVFCFISALPTYAQVKKPSVARCRADRIAWHPFIRAEKDMDDLSFRELERRENEMSSCRFGDKEYWNDYDATLNVFKLEEGRRLRKFVDRHYWDQFIQEDEQGNR